jgi:hypothetical protein
VAASTPAAGSPVGELGAARRATRAGAIAIIPKADAASKAIKKAEAEAAHLAPVKKRGRPVSESPKSKRTEYQRDLMRKRRAAAKDAK